MDAAGIVADHPAERAVGVRRRIGAERQAVPLGLPAQRVEHDARLHAREAPLGIDRDHAVHVFREIEHDRHVAALAGEARAAAAPEDRRLVRAADRDRALDVLAVARDHDADRRLAIVRSVGRIQRAAARVEADFAANRAPERGGERDGVHAIRGAARRRRATGIGARAMKIDERRGLDAHDAKRSASARLKVSPRPGRDRSGLSSPSIGRSTPSNNRRSIRT